MTTLTAKATAAAYAYAGTRTDDITVAAKFVEFVEQQHEAGLGRRTWHHDPESYFGDLWEDFADYYEADVLGLTVSPPIRAVYAGDNKVAATFHGSAPRAPFADWVARRRRSARLIEALTIGCMVLAALAACLLAWSAIWLIAG